MMKIQQLMTPAPITCREGDSLAHAAQLMWNHDIGAVPVVSDDGAVIGMITDRDICMAAYTRGCALTDCSVGSTMSPEVETCTPDTGVQLAEERMRLRQVRRLPVVEQGKLVGIVSLNDLALASTNRRSAKDSSISAQEVATTLARICEHREQGATASH